MSQQQEDGCNKCNSWTVETVKSRRIRYRSRGWPASVRIAALGGAVEIRRENLVDAVSA